MSAHLIITSIAITANAFSGVVALGRFTPIREAMRRVNVPESWLRFPIGTLKVAGALGLLLGLLGVPLVGGAAAAGLVLYFTCAVYTHVLAGDHSSAQFATAIVFLLLATVTLAVELAQ